MIYNSSLGLESWLVERMTCEEVGQRKVDTAACSKESGPFLAGRWTQLASDTAARAVSGSLGFQSSNPGVELT